MSPFKRQARAAAKSRARGGRRTPAPEPLRDGLYPLARESAVQLLLNPHAAAVVPPELADPDYELPHVELPASRPLVSAAELREALADDDTQPLALDGLVVDEAPQPARHAGLAPAAGPQIPVPSNPFLNARPPRHGAAPAGPAPQRAIAAGPRHARPAAAPTAGSALPARLTDVELSMLGRPIPADAPAAPTLAPEPEPYHAVRRDAEHELVFTAFDEQFWDERNAEIAALNRGAVGLLREVDTGAVALDAHLGRLEAAHQALIEQVAGDHYRGQLAAASAPLPRRTPGAALAAIETDRRELVSA